jgi:hypothetical protein
MRLAREVRALLGPAVLLLACDPIGELQGTPFVEKSAAAEARWRIDINRVRDGVFVPYRPRCTDELRIGDTVEFRNFLPDVPANVTGIASPAPLYSPNLVRPYNYVGERDPANTLCDLEVDGACAKRPAYSFWRFTFTTPGVYDWLDTNQGSPGRKVVDPYYGTETFIGIDPSSPIGTICVPGADGAGCAGTCCATDGDCTGETRCYKSDLDAVGRCLTPSG